MKLLNRLVRLFKKEPKQKVRPVNDGYLIIRTIDGCLFIDPSNPMKPRVNEWEKHSGYMDYVRRICEQQRRQRENPS